MDDEVKPKILLGTEESANETLLKWVNDSVGISPDLLRSLDADSDWAFVIKLHGIVEAGLNHLLLSALGRNELRDVIALLATADSRIGKIAFIKACDLLPKIARKFVSMFAKMRDDLVHDIKHFDFSLEKFFADLDPQQRKNWKKALTCWCIEEQDGKITIEEGLEDSIGALAIRKPRMGIYNACMGLLIFSLVSQRETEKNQTLLKIAKELEAKGDRIMKERGWSFEDVEKMMAEIDAAVPESTPMES